MPGCAGAALGAHSSILAPRTGCSPPWGVGMVRDPPALGGPSFIPALSSALGPRRRRRCRGIRLRPGPAQLSAIAHRAGAAGLACPKPPQGRRETWGLQGHPSMGVPTGAGGDCGMRVPNEAGGVGGRIRVPTGEEREGLWNGGPKWTGGAGWGLSVGLEGLGCEVGVLSRDRGFGARDGCPKKSWRCEGAGWVF